MKRVICHYHIFKNSGTTFDRILKRNYGKSHLSIDGPYPYFKINQEELIKIICNTGKQSFSSHQINLPVPTSLNVIAEPVVFLRHPILRIRSIYNFSKKAKTATVAGSLASKSDFQAWVDQCKENVQLLTMLSNAQTRMLSGTYGRQGISRRNSNGAFEFDVHQACRNLSAVQLLGRTEYFDEDVKQFENASKKLGIEFHYYHYRPRNTTSKDLGQSIVNRLENVKAELGPERYQVLTDLNRQDMLLYEYANERLAQM